MMQKVILCIVVLTSYASCRTAKQFREYPESLRLSQAEYPSYNILAPNGPGTYAFGYEIEDLATGNVQFRDEEKLRNGTIRGSYGVLLPDNTLHITRYIADQFGYRANSETLKKQNDVPLKLELQLSPSVSPLPSVSSPAFPQGYQQQNAAFNSPSSTTPFPDPFVTTKTYIDPALAASIYNQHQISVNPTYNPLHDENILSPQVANAILNQQIYPQNPYGLRQNIDGTVSTYQSTSPNRPVFPFSNWFNNNNNGQYLNDPNQPQQGPIISFISGIPNTLQNFAQNNPITQFLNGFQNSQNDASTQNPFQTFFSNLNPFNFFSNTNRPQMNVVTTPVQSDYMSNVPSQSPYPTNNVDSSVFSNDHFLNPLQQYPNINYQSHQNPNYNSHLLANPISSSSYNQLLSNPYGGQLSNQIQSSTLNPYHYNAYRPQSQQQQWSTQHNIQPYSQNYQQKHQYPSYQNPYQTIAPISITSTPSEYLGTRKKTSSKKKKNDKNKVDVPESDSYWFQDFLDKRKTASIESATRRTPPKKANKNDDNDSDSDLDDYFR